MVIAIIVRKMIRKLQKVMYVQKVRLSFKFALYFGKSNSEAYKLFSGKMNYSPGYWPLHISSSAGTKEMQNLLAAAVAHLWGALEEIQHSENLAVAVSWEVNVFCRIRSMLKRCLESESLQFESYLLSFFINVPICSSRN